MIKLLQDNFDDSHRNQQEERGRERERESVRKVRLQPPADKAAEKVDIIIQTRSRRTAKLTKCTPSIPSNARIGIVARVGGGVEGS